MATLVPIAAFLARYFVGIRYIRNSDCGPKTKLFQKIVFCVAILWLLMLDSLMILIQSEVRDRKGQLEFLLVFSLLYSIYLVAMAFAFLPRTGGSFSGCQKTANWYAF